MNENNVNENVTEEAVAENKSKGSFLYETVSVFVTALVIIAVMFTFLSALSELTVSRWFPLLIITTGLLFLQ